MKFVKEILWAAIEDYTGLWQALSEIEAVEPELEEEKKKEYACKAIKSLFLKGYIKFYRGKTFFNIKTEISKLRSLNLLNDPANWLAPIKDDYIIGIRATRNGKKNYINFESK